MLRNYLSQLLIKCRCLKSSSFFFFCFLPFLKMSRYNLTTKGI
jgi:hypothetical protein